MLQDNLGGWSGDDLKTTFDTNTGSAYYSNRDDILRFTHGIAKIIRRRMAMSGVDCERGFPSVFILGPVPDNTTTKAIKVPRLNSGKSKLSGYVWFLSREPISGNGFVAEYDDFKLFDFIISSLQSGKLPAVLFDADESVRTIRCYPQGLQEMDNCTEVLIDGNDINPSLIKTALDTIYSKRLITPEASAYNIKLWEDSDKHHPIKNPEAEIQSHIATGLASKFAGCRIKEEQIGISGRYDIAISEQDPLDSAKWIEHAILELKVIKSYNSAGNKHQDSENKKWLKSGLQQACCYKTEHGSKYAAVCCFDMQDKDNKESCFAHICDEANKLCIELWRWYIYASSKQFRSASTVTD